MSRPGSRVALRLRRSLKPGAERLARAAGRTLDPLLSVAVAEKVSAPRTMDYFKQRAERPLPDALVLMDRAGDEPPRDRDALAGG